jgi:hypothetical protein
MGGVGIGVIRGSGKSVGDYWNRQCRESENDEYEEWFRQEGRHDGEHRGWYGSGEVVRMWYV